MITSVFAMPGRSSSREISVTYLSCSICKHLLADLILFLEDHVMRKFHHFIFAETFLQSRPIGDRTYVSLCVCVCVCAVMYVREKRIKVSLLWA